MGDENKEIEDGEIPPENLTKKDEVNIDATSRIYEIVGLVPTLMLGAMPISKNEATFITFNMNEKAPKTMETFGIFDGDTNEVHGITNNVTVVIKAINNNYMARGDKSYLQPEVVEINLINLGSLKTWSGLAVLGLFLTLSP